FIAAKVIALDDRRPTPAHELNDGQNYLPMNKWVLFGHHFAAISGAGPLIGPVLASQWGFLPGFVWIVIGACMAGAVHDFVILWASVRQNGLSLPKIARENIGPLSGLTTSIATLFIIVCTLASVAIVVVNALSESAWGMFTIIVTIPAALLTGLWMYKIRPGKVAEASVIGVVIVLAGVFLGQPIASTALGKALIFHPKTLSLMLPIYAAIASILPVWVLMCPRDYLSSYMKIGVMIVLAFGIIAANPTLKMPATTTFVSGGGPVIPGAVWPFVCIVIMCGAISGFHSLIASGTTPKMIAKERHIRPIGYGAMVLEGFVAVTALVAACALEPGDYFAINVAQATPAQKAFYGDFVAHHQADSGWDLTAKELPVLENGTQEKLAGRVGGAVTLAVGMAKVFSSFPGMKTLMAYWYHFVIMFEALFILTLLETGTRVARFVFQETLAGASEPEVPARGGLSTTHPTLPPAEEDLIEAVSSGALARRPSWALNVFMSLVVCFGWGYLLYRGELATLWKMLGIANQLLASIALAVGTTYLLNHAPKRIYALCTAIPFVFVIATVFVAGILNIQGWLVQAAGSTPDQAFLLKLMCVLAGIMLGLTAVIALDAVRKWWSILGRPIAIPANAS
ncbi:MAG TPA: carbon starvation protein A, partial [Phycisphaerae bacterium]|nr:carbon starvation protein A [Phycisphaerae bacterium]